MVRSRALTRGASANAWLGAVIANGFLRLDPEEWIRVVEKQSALQGCHWSGSAPRLPSEGRPAA